MSWEMYGDSPVTMEELRGEPTEFVTIKREDYEDLIQIVVAARMLCDAIDRRFGGDL